MRACVYIIYDTCYILLSGQALTGVFMCWAVNIAPRCPRPYGDMKTILHQWVEGLWGDPLQDLQASFQPRLCGWRSRLPQKLSLERSKSCVSKNWRLLGIAQSSSSANRKAACFDGPSATRHTWRNPTRRRIIMLHSCLLPPRCH